MDTAPLTKLLERNRVPCEKEVYSEMYYEERIQPYVEAALKIEGKRKSNIKLIQCITAERWEMEDEEIKGDVKERLAELAALRGAKGPRTPEQYQM